MWFNNKLHKRGEPIFGKKYKNQKLFYKKLDLFKGVQNFISDINYKFKKYF